MSEAARDNEGAAEGNERTRLSILAAKKPRPPRLGVSATQRKGGGKAAYRGLVGAYRAFPAFQRLKPPLVAPSPTLFASHKRGL